MESDVIVEVRDVSMVFNLSTEKVDNLKEYVVKVLKRELFFNEFTALSDINFEIKKGDTFGLVGLNGAGKSTLLKIIAGVLKPTTGHVNVKGEIAPLIELGAGFNFDLSARENIYLNGAVLGFSRDYMNDCFQNIVEFSELHNFIEVPIKNFSSGMVARLAFSIATTINPEILIVDEVLAVGDYKFQEKCKKRMNELMNDGTTVIFVSHSAEQVRDICNKALWIENGRMKMLGTAEEVVNKFSLF